MHATKCTQVLPVPVLTKGTFGFMQGMQEVQRADPLVHDALLDLLLPQLCAYYVPDRTQPPLSLDKCATLQVSLTCAIPYLHRGADAYCLPPSNLHCIQTCCKPRSNVQVVAASPFPG